MIQVEEMAIFTKSMEVDAHIDAYLDAHFIAHLTHTWSVHLRTP